MGFTVLRVVQIAALRGFGALALLLMTFVVARTLDVSDSGKFLYLLSAVLVLSPILVFGTNLTSLRRIAVLDAAGSTAEINGVIVSGFLLLLAGWVALALSLALISPFVDADALPALHWVIGSVPAVLLVSLAMSVTVLAAHQLQGLGQPTHSVIALSIASPVIFSIVMVLAPARFADTDSALGLLVLSSAAALLYALAFLFGHLTPERPHIVGFRPFLGACLPIWIVAISTAVTNWGAQLVAPLHLEPATIALLGVSQRVAMSVSLILIAVNLIISPKIAQLHSAGRVDELQSLVSRAVGGITVLSLPAILVICVFPRPLLSHFGPEYVDAAPYLIVFGLTQFINVVTGPSVQLLTMSGFESVVMRIAVTSSVLTILSALVLIPWIGPIGVPVAAGIGIVSQNVSAALVARRLTSINVFKVALR